MIDKKEDLVKAKCPKGHIQRVYGGYLLVERGEIPRWGAIPIRCSDCELTLGVQR